MTITLMTARRAVVLGLLVVACSAHADDTIDHARTRFPLLGKHASVGCESCHPSAGRGQRKWTGVPLDCRGCHGDRANHKGALGAQCQLCHDATTWKNVKHPAGEHKLALVGKHDLPCASCHAKGAQLKPSVPCASCHEKPHGGTRAACDTCHGVTRWDAVFYKKHTYDPQVLPGKHRTATCLGCHPAYQFKGTTTQCSSCHDKQRPHEDLGECRRCHSPLSWKDVTPDRGAVDRTGIAPQPSPEPGPNPGTIPQPGPTPRPGTTSPPGGVQERSTFRVKAKFNHVPHERLVKARGMSANCASCHLGGDVKKRPAMQVCESCHDGKKAFDALGTQCDRCHSSPPWPSLPALPLPPKTFQHAAHQSRDLNIDDCTSCHGVGVEWQKVEAGRDQHRPCQTCHAAEFRTVGQTICLSCHERNDPFRPNPLRVPTQLTTEFRSPDSFDLQHAPHIAGNVACETCHSKEAGLPARDPISGHAVCGACHLEKRTPVEKAPPENPGEGAAVTLDHCASCHAPLAVRRADARREWSTRDLYRHNNKHHRAEPCARCHLEQGRTDLSPPTMAGCATCHDGKKAFDTQGPGCRFCHGQQ